MWIGRILLWTAMVIALLSAFTYLKAELFNRKQNDNANEINQWIKLARRMFLLMYIFVGATIGYLWWLILTQHYEVVYVHDYTSRDLPTIYRFAALWGGQAGTWLLWAFFTSIWGLILPKFAQPYETATLAILSGLNFLLLLPAGIEDPFRLITPPPNDGRGLNPLLQNYWMAIHPPNMFIGYASMGLPFSLALAGLWRGDWQGWVRYALPAASFGVTALGLGISLGGIWSYEVLGWGGYWAWDPVENASFVPWLACVSLMHALIVQRSSKSAIRLTTFLALTTFLSTYYATFVTRSGFIQSVHNFGTTPLTWWVLAILIVLTVSSFGLLAVRIKQIPFVENKSATANLTSLPFFAYSGMVILGVFATVVVIGLSLPWITIVGKALNFTKIGEFGVDRAFYDRASFPIASAMCLFLAFMPLLTNACPKDEEQWKKWKASTPWLVFNIALLTALLAFLFGIRQATSLILLGSASVCIIGNAYALYLRARKSPLTIGAYVSHLGLGIFILGIVGSELLDSSKQLLIQTEGSRSAHGILFTFTGLNRRSDGKYEVHLHANHLNGGKTKEFTITPIFWATNFGLVREPFIKRYLTHDIYVEPIEYQPPQESGTITLAKGEEKVISQWTVKFTGFELSGKPINGMPEKISAVLEMKKGKHTYNLKPYWKLKTNDIEKRTDKIPNTNIQVGVRRINADEGTVEFSIKGVDGLQGHNGFLVVNIQYKPATNLVWLGALLILFGALISGIRRMKETVKTQTTISPTKQIAKSQNKTVA